MTWETLKCINAVWNAQYMKYKMTPEYLLLKQGILKKLLSLCLLPWSQLGKFL